MDKKLAMEILCSGIVSKGKIDETVVYVAPSDIKRNLEMNDWELDLDFIQDLTCEIGNGYFELLQGHSLSEFEHDHFHTN